MFGALAYAELGTMIPSSGAEYSYFMEAFGPFPAYMFSWVSTFIIKPSQLAIICMSFAAYAVEAFAYECEPDPKIVQLTALATVAVVTFVNCWSVKLATQVQNVFCSCKLVAVAIIICGGFYKLAEGSYDHVASGFKGTHWEFGRLATAFYSGLWAYDGWNNLNYVTEEIINPEVRGERNQLKVLFTLIISGQSATLYWYRHPHGDHHLRPGQHLLPDRDVPRGDVGQ